MTQQTIILIALVGAVLFLAASEVSTPESTFSKPADLSAPASAEKAQSVTVTETISSTPA